MRSLLGSLLGVGLLGPTIHPLKAHAQSAEGRTTCFRGRPRPECKTYFLTEFIAGYQIAGTRIDRGPLLNWELGVMGNFGSRFAVGMAGFVSASDQDGTYGPRLRLRYWVTPRISLDLGPGIAFGRPTPGFNGHLGITADDRFGLVLNLQSLPASGVDPATHGLFAGLRLGSGYGVIAGLAVPLIALIGLATCGCID